MVAILVAISVIAIVILVYTRNTRESLIVVLIVTALLSGFENATVNVIGIQTRRFCILLLALLVFKNKTRLPNSVICLVCASLIGLTGLVQHGAPDSGPMLVTSILILHLPAAMTVHSWVIEPGNKEKIGRVFVFAALIHCVLTALNLKDFTGEARFAGAGSNAPLFAFVGGALLSALLWGLLYETGRVKLMCTLLLPTTVLLTLLGAQRSGLLSLCAAIVPFLVLGLIRYPVRVLKVMSVACAVVWIVISNTNLFDFAFERFSTLDSNGREERWSSAWEFIGQRPIAGWGPGFRDEVGFGVHNSFISIWLELGILGLLFWIAAIVIGLATSLKTLSRYKTEGEGIALLSLSWLSVCVAFAQVEDKLYRPTNLPAVVFLLALLTAAAAAADRNLTSRSSVPDLGATWLRNSRNRLTPAGYFWSKAK